LFIRALVAKIQPDKLSGGAQMAIFGDFLRPVFSARRVQQISDLHLKFALRPHRVWKYGRQSAAAEIRRGKKKKEQEQTTA